MLCYHDKIYIDTSISVIVASPITSKSHHTSRLSHSDLNQGVNSCIHAQFQLRFSLIRHWIKGSRNYDIMVS